MVVGKYKTDQIEWWEKHKHEVQAMKRRKAILKRRNDLERLENDRSKKELEEMHNELNKKLEEINQSKSSDFYAFQFLGCDFDRFEMVLIQKGLYNFKVNWFEFENYVEIDKFSALINEKMTPQLYKLHLGGEFFLNETTQHAQMNLSILLKNLSNGTTVAVNTSKGVEENTHEILMLASKDTNFIGKFLSKITHVAVLVLSKNILQKNTLFFNEDDELFKEESCWLQLNECENNGNDDKFLNEQNNSTLLKGNHYMEKFVNQAKNNELDNKIYFEKIMKKHILQNEQKKLEKALKEKENSYDKFITEKRADIKASEKQLSELLMKKEKIEKEMKVINDKINDIKEMRELVVKEAREKFKLTMELEKNSLNAKFNEVKRLKDQQNLNILSNYHEVEINFRELLEEHQKIDDKIGEIHKKKKQIAEEIESQMLFNKQMEEKIKKFENEKNEMNFFAKLKEISSKSNKETVCLVCAENRREIVNMPCKHLTICSKCYSKIFLPINFRFCLICKQSVDRVVKVLFEKL